MTAVWATLWKTSSTGALSRERYWGTPLPVWTCECGHIHVIGSRQELRDMGAEIPDDLELHKPFIDKVTFPCPQCGKPMHRVPEVIDCWYDSGSMPFAQFHYPFENKELFEQLFPCAVHQRSHRPDARMVLYAAGHRLR